MCTTGTAVSLWWCGLRNGSVLAAGHRLRRGREPRPGTGGAARELGHDELGELVEHLVGRPPAVLQVEHDVVRAERAQRGEKLHEVVAAEAPAEMDRLRQRGRM